MIKYLMMGQRGEVLPLHKRKKSDKFLFYSIGLSASWINASAHD